MCHLLVSSPTTGRAALLITTQPLSLSRRSWRNRSDDIHLLLSSTCEDTDLQDGFSGNRRQQSRVGNFSLSVRDFSRASLPHPLPPPPPPPAPPAAPAPRRGGAGPLLAVLLRHWMDLTSMFAGEASGGAHGGK
ncbi:mediator of RNA polymerase II transcription subunit 10-like [Seriola lalandi dorsalis]|uniref:mediator of RNA polymerase II transcription subunit 10-like n=1 Tax=Seriola lalandi dorsalis TaxID=1841481 RepID=UPI000C6FBD1D|nr:mediator of RNA polymerase II transcription subunit 10-like [Seriola lalandi dorsalis]